MASLPKNLANVFPAKIELSWKNVQRQNPAKESVRDVIKRKTISIINLRHITRGSSVKAMCLSMLVIGQRRCAYILIYASIGNTALQIMHIRTRFIFYVYDRWYDLVFVCILVAFFNFLYPRYYNKNSVSVYAYRYWN